MQNFLLTHAIKNVWCSPDQDKQLILNLKRVSRVGGVKGIFSLHWSQIALPTVKDRYHIFPIGQNSVQRLNIPAKQLVWFNLATLANTIDLLTDIYTNEGHSFNRSKAWIMRTSNNNIVLAVQDQDKATEISSGELFIRFYTNAYFSSVRSAGTIDLKVEGIRVEINNEQLPLQARYHSDKTRPGHAYLFHNGDLVDDVLPSEVVLGDMIEYVYDSSITEVAEWRVSDLRTYKSTLDRNAKYLVHLPKSIKRIDYRDDIDFYLYVKDQYGRRRGRYFHQNHPSICRMITHRDYGISTSAVAHYLNTVEGWDGAEVYLMAFVRESGYDRPLIDEHHRIKELYRLDDAAIEETLLGINSILPEWKANELESSSYTRIMRADYSTLSVDEVLNAYGYNAMAKIMVNGLTPIEGNNIALPPGLTYNSTILEYDIDGLLLGHYAHSSGNLYVTRSAKTVFIEGYPGVGGNGSTYKLSEGEHHLSANYGYRFYKAIRSGAVIKSDWTEVTDDGKSYEIVNGKIKWLLDPATQIGAYQTTADFFLQEYVLSDSVEFIYEFDISEELAYRDSKGMDMGQVLIWLNSRSLIEGLDYTVIDGHVNIVNMEYMIPGARQYLLVMCLDRPTEMSHDQGFVIRDRISVNSIYNVRDDKVVRCIVDGKVRYLPDMDMDEDVNKIVAPKVTNGKPYSIRTVPVPVHGVKAYDAYPFIERSMDVDRRIGQFLTQQLPPREDDGPAFIESRYQVFSPVCAKILSDFRYNLNDLPDLARGDDAIQDFMEDYLYLLPFDPTRMELDSRHVYIAPHRYSTRISISSKQYRILNRIVELYLRNKVDISYGIEITE